MDCVGLMDPGADAPLAAALAAATVRPRIVQLSPISGNIYKTDRFYYDPTAVLSKGPFGAVLASAAAHGHPVVIHDCLDIQEFQAAHLLAIIHPISEISPLIIARGLSLLTGIANVTPPIAAQQRPPVVTEPLPVAGLPQFLVQTAPSTVVDGTTSSHKLSPLLS